MNNAGGYFVDRLPGFVSVSAARVASDAIAAADRGRRTVIPGGPVVRAAFGPNRLLPSRLTLAFSKRLITR